MKPADTNPVTKPFCQSCKFWEPVGFYTFEREMDTEKRKCKHLNKCNRVFSITTRPTGQMQLSDFVK